MVFTFNCAVCLEEGIRGSPIVASNLHLCRTCVETAVVDPLRNALKWEHHFPPRLAGEVLDPEDFVLFLPRGFLQEYNEKKREYTTPPKERRYCAICQVFLRGRATGTVACSECSGLTCSPCGAYIASASELHVCKSQQGQDDGSLEGLVRGKDYQLCPACSRPTQLAEACNHMSCVCQAQYCYICGQHAMDTSGHWGPGGCPRWNQPGEEGEQFDDPLFGDEERPPPPPPRVGPDLQELIEMVEEMSRALETFPSIAHLAERSPQEQLQAERELVWENWRTCLPAYTWNQLGNLDGIIQALDSVVERRRTQGRPVDDWFATARRLAVNMRENTDIYVYRIRTVHDFDQYQQRHQAVVADARGPHRFLIDRFFPQLMEIYAAYDILGDARLRAARRQIQADGAPDFDAADEETRQRVQMHLMALFEGRTFQQAQQAALEAALAEARAEALMEREQMRANP